LYEKTSAKGTVYLTGRLGGAKVVLLRDRQAADDGTVTWSLLLSEAAPRQIVALARDEQAPTARQAASISQASAPADPRLAAARQTNCAPRPAGNGQRPVQCRPPADRALEDEIPF
jgi:hypothetical protein